MVEYKYRCKAYKIFNCFDENDFELLPIRRSSIDIKFTKNTMIARKLKLKSGDKMEVIFRKLVK
jgi:hypothetical protein